MPSRRVQDLCKAIRNGKDSLDQTDLRRIPLDRDWNDLCLFLAHNHSSNLMTVVLPLHKLRRGSIQARRDFCRFLQDNDGLQHVILSSDHMESNTFVEQILTVLSKSESVRTIEFRRIRLKDPQATTFLPLQASTSLHSVRALHLDPATEHALFDAMTTFENVGHLKVVGGSDADANAFLPKLSFLQSLVVERQGLSRQALQSIADLAHHSSFLQNLTVKIQECGPFWTPAQTLLPPNFLAKLGASTSLQRLCLHKLNWSNMPCQGFSQILLPKSSLMERVVLEGISDEQGRAMLRAEMPASLGSISLNLDWVSVETLLAAESCFSNNVLMKELYLDGPLIPKMTWRRSSSTTFRRAHCLADLSFCEVDWDILMAWMQRRQNLALSKTEFAWFIKSLDEHDILQLSQVLKECQHLTALDLFWSPRFSRNTAQCLVANLCQNTTVREIYINDGLRSPENDVAKAIVAWLRQECHKVGVRNRVACLMQSRAPSALGPCVLGKGDLSTTFLALQEGIWNTSV